MTVEMSLSMSILSPFAHYIFLNPCHAEYIKMPHPLLIFSQSDYLVQTVNTNSHT